MEFDKSHEDRMDEVGRSSIEDATSLLDERDCFY